MTIDNASSRAIAAAVYTRLLLVYRERPEWLEERIRGYAWESPEVKAKSIGWIVGKLRTASEIDEAIDRLLPALGLLFRKAFFTSTDYVCLVNTIQNILQRHRSRRSSMILLDAENLSLEENLEKILLENSRYPIRIKYAFGNWRGLGRQAIDLHQRGYHLIHVPSDKNNTDFKMTAWSIPAIVRYPHLQEVFVCSSDRDLDHLAISLLNEGIEVVRVFRKGDELTIVDMADYLAAAPVTESILPLEKALEILQSIVDRESRQSGYPFVKLSKLGSLFEEEARLSIDKIARHYGFGENATDLLLRSNFAFSVQTIEGDGEVYISRRSTALKFEEKNSRFTESQLEKIIDRYLIENDRDRPLTIGEIAERFVHDHEIPLKQVTGDLGFGKNLPKALEKFKKWQIEGKDNVYRVRFIAGADSDIH